MNHPRSYTKFYCVPAKTLTFQHPLLLSYKQSIFEQMQSEVKEKLKATVCYKTLNFLNIHSLIRTKPQGYGEERIMMNER